MYDLKTGDLNDDGLTDIITARGNPNRIEIYYNAGNDLYDGPMQLSYGAGLPRGLTISDVNLDGLNDIIFITDSGNVKYLLQHPFGFNDPVIIDENREIQSFGAILSEDLDGDDIEDLIVLEHIHPTLYQHRSDGSYAPAKIMIDSSDFSEIYSICTGKFNGDNLKDITFGGGGYHVYFNEGAMNFSLDSNYFETLIFGLEAKDFDQNGRDDLLLKSSAVFKTILSDDSGTFTEKTNFNPSNVSYTDFKPIIVNGDAHPDVAAIYNQLDNVVWFENDGNGKFSDEKIIASFKGIFLSRMDVADMNGDGLEDLIYGGISLLAISLQENPLSLNNISTHSIDVFPVPAINEINISITPENVESLQIFNYMGKLQCAVIRDNKINISELTSGTYFLKWSTKQQSGILSFSKIAGN